MIITSSPDIVIIQFGTNDIKQKYWNENQYIIDYLRIIKQFQNLDTKPLVYINIPPPSYSKIDVFGIPSKFQNKFLPKIGNNTYNTNTITLKNRNYCSISNNSIQLIII